MNNRFSKQWQSLLQSVVVIVAVALYGSLAFAQPTTLRLTEPASGTTLRAGTSVDLVWDTTGTFRSRFRFDWATSRDAATWTSIVANRLDSLPTANRGRFNGGFRVPSISTESLFIRMTLLNADGTPSAVQTINGPMTIVRPLPTAVDSVLTGRVARGQRLTLRSGRVYALDGYFYVDSLATLNIEPGTMIVGDTVGQNSAICVNRGGVIFANGTPTRPIVMTSSAPPGQRSAGDWGGLLICGRARTNQPGGTATLEGGIANTLTGDGIFGGTDDNDSSGVVRYVRIEFAGIAAAPNQELNSLTMGGVGRRTRIEYVQCSYGNDDAFEWFGGTVDGRYLVATATLDDDFDGDNGWSGRVQFGFAQRYRLRADVSTSQAFEMDNDAGGSFNQPLTRAIFSNMTAVGPVQNNAWTTGRGDNQFNAFFGAAAQLRRNNRTSIVNSVFVGWRRGFEILGVGSQGAASRDSILVRNNSWYGVQSVALQLDGTTPGIPATWLETSAFSNVLSPASVEPAQLGNPFIENSNAIDPRPRTIAPYLANATSFTRPQGSDVAIDDAFFQRVPYRGAFGAAEGTNNIVNRWDLPWAEYDPQSYEYRSGAATQRVVSVRDRNVLEYDRLSVTAFPIPARDVVTVRYNLPKADNVSIRIYDMLGNVVFTPAVNLPQAEGVFEFQLNVQSLAPGAYIVRVESSLGSTAQKLNVIR
ncbi:MAG: T9SS type A sorting domain-containing protein [Candidatus Kapabacteria bacterium]|jgi:hypothetical protein|nr:T9SS type A sorting domain-containing protein [Candidatus Kapabacteria bacterium]